MEENHSAMLRKPPFFGQLSPRLLIGHFHPDIRATPRLFNPKKRQLSF
jgi:hypothetical protein